MVTESSRIRVRLRLTPTEDGGLAAPVASGSMFQCDLGDRFPNGMPDFHAAILVNLRPDPLSPGDDGDGDLDPLDPDLWDGVDAGDTLGLNTGSFGPCVGSALVVSRELIG
jgi:hypothetical protein